MPISRLHAPRLAAPATLLSQSSFLAALPADVHERLLPHFNLIEMAPGQELGAAHGCGARALFPLAGVISLVQQLPDGDSGQVAVVGREGLWGLPLVMGGESMPTTGVVQCPGHALSLPRDALLEEFERGGPFMRHVLRYTQALITQMSLLVLCNRHHSIEQQLCRVLLMSLDRVNGHEVPLTQEFVARLLGVRREGVTEASGKLRESGAVTCRRGLFSVRERDTLEHRACSCYHAVRTEYARLLPVHSAQGSCQHTPVHAPRPVLPVAPAWPQLTPLAA